jgi:type IV pilus assembly protein PilF
VKTHFIITLFAVVLLQTGCVTTTTGGVGGEKWDKDERAALHTQMGMTYLQQGQIEVAREELILALSIQPDSSGANLAMAKLQRLLGNSREASTHFARSVRYNRNNFAARIDYGSFLCTQGDYDAGFEQFTEALNNPLNRTQYISLFGAAECARMAGDMDRAVEYYEQTLNMQPDMRQALLQLAMFNFDRGEHFTARAFLERFFADRFYTADSLFLAVRNELQLDRRDLASDYARLLRERFPGSQRIEELRGLFQDATG